MFDILKFLDDAPIKLVEGVGDPDSGGCWMSAISVYAGNSWSDHPECVCPVIRAFAISINDSLPSDEARGRVIGPHILDPVGTKTDDPGVIAERKALQVDEMVRVWAPYLLRKAGLNDSAVRLESLPPVTGDNWTEARRAMNEAYDYAYANANAYANAYAYAYANANANAYAYAYANANAYAYANANANVNDYAVISEEIATKLTMPTLVKMCQIGNPVIVEPSCDEMELRRALQCE